MDTFQLLSYESCSTAAFKHGRTETVRSTTQETTQFAEAFVQGKKPSRDLLDLLQAVTAKHNKLTQEAALGQGFDLHLFALRKTDEEKCSLIL
jgi:carnitine O-palmitoyltransferase 2